MSTNVSTVYTYQLNGVTVDFKIPFDYLSRKFVKVTLLGKDRKVLNFMTDYRFMSPTLIRTVKPWGSSDGYNYIEIRRETSARDLIVDFSDGSILRANDLNTANLQAMHIAEEARSLAADSLGVNDDGNLDARFRKIVNLGDPVGRKDAVTKAYVDDAKDSVIDSRDKAKQYRDEAQSFRNQTETIKNQTNTIKNQAVTETNLIKDESRKYANASNSYASESKAQIAKAQSLVEDVRDEGTIVNGYAQATIEHAKASAANAQVAQINATASQKNKEACAGYEAATAVYEQRAREVESTVVAAKDTAEQKAKEANLSASKANTSKDLAEKARAAAASSASQTNLYKDSAAESAAAAARDAKSAETSAGNALSQAGAALASAQQAKTSETNAQKYAASINPDNLMPKAGGTFTGSIAVKRSIIVNGTDQVYPFTAIDKTRDIGINLDGINKLRIQSNSTYGAIMETKYGTITFPPKAGALANYNDVINNSVDVQTMKVPYLGLKHASGNTGVRLFNAKDGALTMRVDNDMGGLIALKDTSSSIETVIWIPKKSGTMAVTSDIKAYRWKEGIASGTTATVKIDPTKTSVIKVRSNTQVVTIAADLPSNNVKLLVAEMNGSKWYAQRPSSVEGDGTTTITVTKEGGDSIVSISAYTVGS